MRRLHRETQELVAARVQDYLEGNSSEVVLLASLKALGLDAGDRDFEVWKANVTRTQRAGSKS